MTETDVQGVDEKKGASAPPPPPRPSLRRQLLRGGSVLTISEGIAFILKFLRSIVVARILSPPDFGIAATFVITMQFLEMLSDLGADKLLVQCKEEESRRLQQLSQLMTMVRGVLIGLLILALAGPIAHLFRTPDAVGAYRWLALVPVIRGLTHQDLIRMQRELRFGPWVKSQIASSVLDRRAAWRERV